MINNQIVLVTWILEKQVHYGETINHILLYPIIGSFQVEQAMTTALSQSDNTSESNSQNTTVEQLLKKIALLETENKRLETWLGLVSKGYSIAINQLSVNSRMP